MFSENKLTQAAGFLLKALGNKMNYMKLIKLLYLADREMLKRYGFSISSDNYFAMENGMVLSRTLDLIKRIIPGKDWEKNISQPSNYEVSLIGDTGEDLLSEAEIAILNETIKNFGSKTEWQLSRYMHKELPEWKDPQKSSIPVSLREILDVITDDEEFKEAAIKEFEEHNSIQRIVGE